MSKIETRLQYGSSIALDFLSGIKTPDGKFIAFYDHSTPKGDAGLIVHLQVASTLLTGARFYDKDNLRKTALAALESVNNSIFEKDDMACIIANEQSHTAANAIASSIFFKLGEKEKGTALAKAIFPCIGKNCVTMFFGPGSRDPKTDQQEQVYGFLTLPLIMAYRASKEQVFLDTAKQLMDMTVRKGRYDHLDIWALRGLYEITKESGYAERADHLISAMNNRPIEPMASMTAAMTLLANLAWVDVLPEGKIDHCHKLTDYLLELQDRDTGAFHVSRDHMNEYETICTVRATNTLMTHLIVLEDRNFSPFETIL
jgi:hypothetical protein